MKKLQLLLIWGALLLTGCQMMTFEDDEENGITNKGSKTMYFRLTGFSMSNLDESRDYNPAPTRAGTDLQNATDHLLLGIYDMDGQIVDSITYQDKDDVDLPYGTFSHTLNYGKYTILAIGWNGTQQCHVHSLDSIYFSEGWVPNTFLCRQNIIVNESYSDTRTISLKRCIARFVLKFTDTIMPEEIKDFVVTFSGAGNTLNSGTRHCVQQQDFSRKIDVNIDPSKVKSITSYCFLPADSTSVSVNVAAHDINGGTIAERTFTEVPMKINYSTNYTGKFFPISSVSETVTFEVEFDGEFNNEF